MKQKNKNYFSLLKLYQHTVLPIIENSFDIIQILSCNLAWLYLLHSKEDYDTAELSIDDDIVIPPVIDLYDEYRDAIAMKEIRDVEAREFGQVDASTHRDMTRQVERGELMQMAEGPAAHPILQKEAYFSGVDDLRNNPLYENNEAAAEALIEQLRHEHRLKLEKRQENVNAPGFNPRPSPYR